METQDFNDEPLQGYRYRSVWTIWTISFDAIRKKDKNAANLLLLWAFLNNKDLWHGLFADAYRSDIFVAERLSNWIGDLASDAV